MMVLAVFLTVFALGVILALWSMREFSSFESEKRVAFPQETAEKKSRGTERKKVSLKGEVVLKKERGIVLSANEERKP